MSHLAFVAHDLRTGTRLGQVPFHGSFGQVLNGTGINGLASQAADRLGQLGWPDLRTGDTGGTYPENTVYFPPQLEAQAQTLAQDLGIARVRPSVDGMRDDRLTVVLISRPSSLS